MAFLERDRVIALDIGASKIVLADFRLSGDGLELLHYGIETIDSAPGEDADQLAYIAANVRSLMREHGIHPAPLVMCVSGQSVFPRYVKLPPVGHDKVEQIVRYEAEQNVPFPIDEVVWDYQLLGGEDGEQNVMLVAVKTDNVRRLTDAVEVAELEPEIVDVAPMALYNAVRFNYPELPECTMVLDIGARSSNLLFIQDTRIFSRSIPVAGIAITQEIMKALDVEFEEAERLKREYGFVSFGGVYAGPDDETAERVSKVIRNVITRLHAEVSRSVNFYRSQQGGSPPSLVLLCGGSSVIEHLDVFFREKLNVDVEYLNPFVNVSVSEALDTDVVSGDLHLLGEVVGLGLRHALACPIEINLMPPELVARKVLRRRQPYFAVAGAAVILTMLCWWVYAHRMGRVIRDRVTDVTERVDRFDATQKVLDVATHERKVAQARLVTLAQPVNQRGQWLRLFDSVHACMWEGMWVTAWKPVSENGIIAHVEITVHGFTDKMETSGTQTATERFRDALLERSEFENAEIKSEMMVGAGRYLRVFVIRLQLATPLGSGGPA